MPGNSYFFIQLIAFTLLFTGNTAFAQKASNNDIVSGEQLLEMSFEDLMQVHVITPALNLQHTHQAPVMVVTREEIRLRGYKNLAEVLEYLPGFTVQDKSDPQFYDTISAVAYSARIIL